MPPRIKWTAERDRALLEARSENQSWDYVCAMVGVSRWTAIDRWKKLGASGAKIEPPAPPKPPPLPPRDLGPPRVSHEALPAGHPRTWNAITRGTCLEGEPYPHPVFGR